MDKQNTYHNVKYKGMVDAFIQILKKEGILGFYRGIIANILRVTPSAALTFMFFEQIKKILLKKRDDAINNFV